MNNLEVTEVSEEAPKKTYRAKKEKAVSTKLAHMSKIDKVAAQLPQLSTEALNLFATANRMSTGDINALVAHLSIEIRRRGVLAVVNVPRVEVGQRVTVNSGHPRFQGQSGVVTKCQRIRCYVRLDGRDKDDYFFVADVMDNADCSATLPPAPDAEFNTFEESGEYTTVPLANVG